MSGLPVSGSRVLVSPPLYPRAASCALVPYGRLPRVGAVGRLFPALLDTRLNDDTMFPALRTSGAFELLFWVKTELLIEIAMFGAPISWAIPPPPWPGVMLL